MNHFAVIVPAAEQVRISLPAFDVPAIFVRLVALVPLIGGYLLVREGRGNILLEILSVILLVLATVVPVVPTADKVPQVESALLQRWPAMLVLLGLAFTRDKGAKIVLGLLLVALGGFFFLESVSATPAP